MLKVLTEPNPILRKKSLPVADILAEKIQKLIPEMIETMILADGAGLAAPQVGENVRLITVNFEDGAFALINPKIIKKSLAKEWAEEGCLSVPNTFGEVKRSKRIKVRYWDKTGKIKTLAAKGLLARVIQHEVNHLDGILFIDKARKIKKYKR